LPEKRTLKNLIFRPDPWIVQNGVLAIFLVLLVVGLSGLTAAYIQVITTNRVISPELLTDTSFLMLLSVDLMAPLTVALLSRRAFIVYLVIQTFLDTILLHYTIFFYNTLTLSTIYHSMQGAASLGIDILGFARWDIIGACGALLVLELFLVQISMGRRTRMPKVFKLRGVTAVALMTILCWQINLIYGKTGLTLLWVDTKGHRPAAERRLEEGTRASVRSIGYLATWLGEFLSGNYKDTTLIYAESPCAPPDGGACLTEASAEGARQWQNLPLPPLGRTVVLIQAESLDFAVLDMRVNGRTVTPFLNYLARRSLVLKVFAPHKVGSCNSDYEILNSRVAEQNVIYYTYIKEYPDSIIPILRDRGYRTQFFHGLAGSLFNLREAYTAQGFEDFHFKEELMAEGYRPGPYIMEHILDEDVFKSAADHLDPEVKSLQFIVTMSSHVPFIKPTPEFKSAGGKFARYVTSLNYLDEQLAEYYHSLPEGTTLIIWGDHGSDVEYPRGFAAGYRQVPFIVHTKYESDWLEDLREAKRRFRLDQPGYIEPQLADDDQIHSLCELSHYLRCLFNEPRP